MPVTPLPVTPLPATPPPATRRVQSVARMLALALLSATPLSADPASQKDAPMTATTAITVTITDTDTDTTLAATLDATPVARDFAALLPLELTLSDYHGIEKVADLPRSLDTRDAPAAYAAQTGDITLYAPWGNLAIFLKPFEKTRGLIRLGAFDGALGALAQKGELTVRIAPAK